MPLNIQAGSKDKQIIEKAYSFIPEKYKHLPVDVRVVNPGNWKHGKYNGSTGVTGPSGSITGANIDFKDGKVNLNLALHEFCHVVVGLAPVAKWKEWYNIYPSIKNGVPTKYGRKEGAGEGLPECLVKKFNNQAKGYKPMSKECSAAVNRFLEGW